MGDSTGSFEVKSIALSRSSMNWGVNKDSNPSSLDVVRLLISSSFDKSSFFTLKSL